MDDDTPTRRHVKLTGLLPLSQGRPASGGRIHDFVVRTIGAWILGARYKPGDVLPREDDLTASLGVSRTCSRSRESALRQGPPRGEAARRRAGSGARALAPA